MPIPNRYPTAAPMEGKRARGIIESESSSEATKGRRLFAWAKRGGGGLATKKKIDGRFFIESEKGATSLARRQVLHRPQNRQGYRQKPPFGSTEGGKRRMSNEEKVVRYKYRKGGSWKPEGRNSLHNGAEMVRKACAPRCGQCAGRTHVIDIEYEVGMIGEKVESITVYVEIGCNDIGSGCDWMVEMPADF